MKRAKKTGFFSNKKSKSAKSAKTKKYGVIFVISLLVIVLSSLIILGIGGLFNSNSDTWGLEDGGLVPVDKVSGKTNILILGVDKEGLRTDTIIVASYDATNGTVNLLSIPRDTRMYIGSKYRKINEAHAISQSNGKIKGPAGTIDAVTRLTGIPINYYVEFSFEAFRDTIDALGGVNFDVPQRMRYQDSTQGLNINLSKGYQLLDGDKAEQLVRFRMYPEGDIKRVQVQQDFIKAVVEQKLNLQIVTKIPELYKTLSENVKTNLSLSDIVRYANSLLDIDREKIVMHQLPGQYSGSEYAASYWLPDMKEIKLLVQNTFGYDTENITSGKPIANAVYGKHTTEILNADDVVILEQDKHKPSVKENSSANSSSKADEEKTQDSDDEKSESKQEEDEASSEDKTLVRPNSSESSDKEDEKDTDNKTENTPEKEEPETSAVPQTPVVKPLEGMESSEDFVRPGAN